MITVTSTSFEEGQPIPERHAVGVPDGNGKAAPEGGNISPHLAWSGAPEGTRSFAVACVDEDVPAEMERMNQEDDTIEGDAPRQPFAHWLVVDIPPETTEIAEGAASSDGLTQGGKPTGPTSYGGRAGKNGYTDFFADDEEMQGTYGGYDGPFPPFNDERVHRYRFRVYALDTDRLDLPDDFGREDFERAIEGHVLDRGELVGTYTLHR